VKVQKIIGRSLGPKEYLFVEKNHRNKKANKMAAVKK
jgi:hypothetical protein